MFFILFLISPFPKSFQTYYTRGKKGDLKNYLPFVKGDKRGIFILVKIHPNPPLKKEGVEYNFSPFSKGGIGGLKQVERSVKNVWNMRDCKKK
ncbi:MAG: hypothetical protein NC825_00140 [Candidatus Omnitrophica bacterium]|nr:hypothetical protein [Candidatus Omnitrophota bacterium]